MTLDRQSTQKIATPDAKCFDLGSCKSDHHRLTSATLVHAGNGGCMQDDDSDPKSVGPWTIESINFREHGRSSYLASTGTLKANILVVEMTPESRSGFRSNLQRAKRMQSLEIPQVLDLSVDRSPSWVASDLVPGRRLSQRLDAGETLTLDEWAELAQTALIGCAALRYNQVRAFQISTNSFVLTDTDILMSDIWAGSYNPGPLYPTDGKTLSDLDARDDHLAIARLLSLAMGSSLETFPPTVTEVTSRGFTAAHAQFVADLANDNASQQFSTEGALRAIPGRDPSWTVPVFALDKPQRARAKRRLQRIALWGGGAAALAAVAFGIWLITGGQLQGADSSAQDNPAGMESPPEEPSLRHEARITFTREEFGTQTQEVNETYDFLWCYPLENLRVDEIPDRLVFQELINDEWQTDRSVQVDASSSPDCADDEVGVSFSAPLPSKPDKPLGWTGCRDYRVLIPRLSSERRAPIRYCLQVRAYEEMSS